MTMIHVGSSLGEYDAAMVKDVVPSKPQRRRSYDSLEDRLCQSIKDEFEADMMLLEPEDNETMDSQEPQLPLTKILWSLEQHQLQSQEEDSIKVEKVQSLLDAAEADVSTSPRPSRFDTIFSSPLHTKTSEIPPLPQQRKPSSNNLVEWDTEDENDDDEVLGRNSKIVRKARSCPNNLSSIKSRRNASFGSFSSFLPTINEFQRTSFDNNSSSQPVSRMESCRNSKKKVRSLPCSSIRSKRSMRHSVSLPSYEWSFHNNEASGSNHNQTFPQQEQLQEQNHACSLPFPQFDRSYVL